MKSKTKSNKKNRIFVFFVARTQIKAHFFFNNVTGVFDTITFFRYIYIEIFLNFIVAVAVKLEKKEKQKS